MGTPYVGEIRMFGGNFAPAGWFFCDGSLLPISEYETLFQLLGTTYGGDGESTFAVPDLRGRLPNHQGTGPGLSTYVIGQQGGAEQVTLTVNQIPAHTHAPLASTGPGGNSNPVDNIWATAANNFYSTAAPNSGAPLPNDAISPAGGSQPHDNVQPFLCVSFIISLFGIFPSPS